MRKSELSQTSWTLGTRDLLSYIFAPALTGGLAFRVVAFVKKLIDAYLDIPYVETLCKYACSDQYVGLSKAPREHAA